MSSKGCAPISCITKENRDIVGQYRNMSFFQTQNFSLQWRSNQIMVLFGDHSQIYRAKTCAKFIQTIQLKSIPYNMNEISYNALTTSNCLKAIYMETRGSL